MGLRDQFPHSLVPLDLAVLIVQQEVYGESGTGRGVDPNAIATYIAATAPLYELARSAATAPRMLIGVHREAVFRDGGRELAFLDGRPSKYLLAVEAEEVPCVIAMLKEPHRAQSIRSEAVEKKSRRLVQRSRDLRAHHSDLVRDFKALQAYAEQLGRAYHARHDGGQSGRLAP